MHFDFIRQFSGGSMGGKASAHVRRTGKRRQSDRQRSRIARQTSANFEPLEQRALMTASNLVISEFLAINNTGLKDQDNAFSDWIEIRNRSVSEQSLDGWHLTDNDNNLLKWTFPDVSIPAGGYLVVFASGKDRHVAGNELHTNFSLSGGGEYLGLVEPDGVTIASEFTPTFPTQVGDISYGTSEDIVTTQLLSSGATGKLLVPSGDIGSGWTATNYNDSAWTNVSTGIGFDSTAVAGNVQAYSNPAGSNGNQSSTLAFGQDFTVNQPISITQLGVFDSGSDGLKRPLTSQIWRRDSASTGTKMAELQFTTADPGTLVNGDRYKALATPLILPAGTYSVVAYGYGGSAATPSTYEPLGNAGLANAPSPRTLNDGGGVLSFTGTRFTSAAGSYPVSTNAGIFTISAGTFAYTPSLYNDQIATNLQAAMLNVNPTAYLRLPFNVSDLGSGHTLTLKMKYDDGYVAYLNGVEIARSTNVVGTQSWNSAASSERANNLAAVFESIDISSFSNLLQAGTNVLAIQGLNASIGNTDFLLNAELVDQYVAGNTPHYYSVPTPGALNSTQYYSTVADTKFDHDRGFYTIPFDVTISTATAGATIRYTTDGSTPTSSSGSIYTGPVHIGGTTTLRAAAFLAGSASTNIDTVTYLFPDDIIRQSETNPPAGFPTTAVNNQQFSYGMDPDIVNDPLYSTLIKSSLTAIPTISIVTDTNNLFNPSTNPATGGIYVNPSGSGAAWERKASVELINPDGTDGFQIDAGIRIRGGFSRDGSNPKHAFKLYFGDAISGDSKLNYPLFGSDGADSFEQLDLRTAQNYSWSFGGDPSNQMIEDRYARLTQKDMGDQYTRSVWYHLYIDGQYWGIYESQERSEASFGATYFGGDKSEYDVVKVNPQAGYTIYATDGNMTAWSNLFTGSNQLPAMVNDQTAAYTQYMKLQGLNVDGTRNLLYPVLLDVDNLINYMEVIFYGGNLDAPISNFLGNTSPNNWYGIRNRNGELGFQFFAHDSEHTLRNVDESRVGPYSSGNNDLSKSSPQWIHQMLMNVKEYRVRFSDHVQKDFFNDGVFTPNYATARYEALRDELSLAMVAESARWGDSKTATPLKQSDYINATNGILNNYLPVRAGKVLAQLKATTLFLNGGTGASAPLYSPTLDAPTFSVNGTPKHGGVIVPTASLTLGGTVAGTKKIYYTTDGTDPRKASATAAAGSYAVTVAPTATEYTGAISLNGTTTVNARILNTVTQEWSALDTATFAMDQSALRITEIMYNPAPPPVGSPYTAGDFEYIELQNTGATAFNLQGVHFTTGIDYTFPSMMIAAGERIVLASNPAAFATRYPGVTVAGAYTGALNNGGDELGLFSALNTQILDFEYKDGWYPLTDGGGYSLVIVNSAATTSTWGTKESWRTSQFDAGNPSLVDNGVNPDAVVINEVLSNTAGGLGRRIELKNTTNAPIDISGWYLSNVSTTDADLKKFKIPAGTIIAAGGYVVFDEFTSFGNPAPAPGDVPFTLSLLGDTVLLTSSDGAGNTAGYRVSESFGAAAAEVPFTRYIKSTGGKDFVAETSATFGSANAAPVVGPIVINEVMYSPLAVQDEFIELFNLSNASVPLYDPANPTNTWSFTQGVTFAFPANTSIAAGGYALVVGIDPATFRTKYSVPAEVQIFGPYVGTLDNTGETLQLSRPGVPQPGNVIPQIETDRLTYDNGTPWPIRAAGSGYALNRVVSGNYGNDVINWSTSALNGTPGRLNVEFDLSPPTAPTNVTPTMFNGTRIDLTWTPATDAQTGVSGYRIFRDSQLIGTSATASFSDTTVTRGVLYSYKVSALNGDAIEGPQSNAATIRIVGIESVSSSNLNQVQIRFTSPVTSASANVASNYTIAGIAINSAVLQADNQTVLLTTSTLADNANYTVFVNNIVPVGTDPIAPNLQFTFFAGAGVGLHGDYYDNQDFTGALLSRTDPQLNFAWGSGSPDPSMGVDQFSVRWSGFVRAQFTETYTFTTTSDDGVRFWINDNLVIDHYVDQGDTDYSYSIALTAGQKYAIRMDFYENGGGATAKLAWSSASTPKAFIPTSQLFLPPTITIADATISEGNSGTKNLVFPVALDFSNSVPITMVYTTAGTPTGTGTAGTDYTATTGTLTIPAGATTANITVPIVGDAAVEANETFFVKLSLPINAMVGDGLGQGTIVDDDGVPAATILGRKIVYNNTKFDGNSGAGGASDDAAIATDKAALLPGGTATFANYSSFSGGINSVFVDIANPSHTPTLADFTFKVGNNNSPGGWAAATAPLGLTVRTGAGTGGSDRVQIIWADGAIKNTWLQTTVNTTLGLAAADVFYFGNAIGESGGSGNAIVNSTDEIAARNNPRTFLNPAPIDFNYDFNRDGYVNATDQILARANSTTAATALNLITVPASLATAAPSFDSGALAMSGAVSTQQSTSGQVASAPVSATPSLVAQPAAAVNQAAASLAAFADWSDDEAFADTGLGGAGSADHEDATAADELLELIACGK